MPDLRGLVLAGNVAARRPLTVSNPSSGLRDGRADLVGSLTGPWACQPNERARTAKSGAGSSISRPMLARSTRLPRSRAMWTWCAQSFWYERRHRHRRAVRACLGARTPARPGPLVQVGEPPPPGLRRLAAVRLRGRQRTAALQQGGQHPIRSLSPTPPPRGRIGEPGAGCAGVNRAAAPGGGQAEGDLVGGGARLDAELREQTMAAHAGSRPADPKGGEHLAVGRADRRGDAGRLRVPLPHVDGVAAIPDLGKRPPERLRVRDRRAGVQLEPGADHHLGGVGEVGQQRLADRGRVRWHPRPDRVPHDQYRPRALDVVDADHVGLVEDREVGRLAGSVGEPLQQRVGDLAEPHVLDQPVAAGRPASSGPRR